MRFDSKQELLNHKKKVIFILYHSFSFALQVIMEL